MRGAWRIRWGGAAMLGGVFAALLPMYAGSRTVRLAITADNGICTYRHEKVYNCGRRSRVRVKGLDHYYMFAFDASSVRTWSIRRATLHVKLAGGRLRRVGFSTVAVGWTEGTGSNAAQRGSPCFTHVRYPDEPWTPTGGTMLDVTFNHPRMLWRPGKVKAEGRWLHIDVAPELIYAVAHGLSFGLAMSDDTGQTRENHDIYTREQSNAKPYLTVEGEPAAPRVPASRPGFTATPWIEAADFRTGAIRFLLDRPAGIAGAGARISLTQGGRTVRDTVTLGSPEILMTGLPPRQIYEASVTHYVGGQVFAGPTQRVRSSPAQVAPTPAAAAVPDRMPAPTAREGWSARVVPVTALVAPNAAPTPIAAGMPVPLVARGGHLALAVALWPPGDQGKSVTVHATAAKPAGSAGVRTSPLEHVRLYRTWYVPAKDRRVGEICVPLPADETIDIPWARNHVPGQRNQHFVLEVWIPPRATPGPYGLHVQVDQGGQRVLDVPIRFQVARTALPQDCHIVGSMNAYGSPGGALGARPRDVEAFLKTERDYYRLAHAHRMTLNVLPYSQAGTTDWRGAPVLAWRGGTCRVADWSAWDQRYGPLLDGTAFTPARGYVGPGQGVGVNHIYLPFHENWPAPLAGNFRPWPPPRDYAKLLGWLADLPPIETCFSEASRAAWRGVLREFQTHFREKGWTHTRYRVYLNDKYYFRRNRGRGISLWLLDEPVSADDFGALAYFGRLTRRALSPARRGGAGSAVAGDRLIDFRIDISRPAHQRNWLDGLVDLNVCADQLYEQREWMAYRRRNFGETYWNYAMPPSFQAGNDGWAVWPVRSYCWGAVGTLPWQTLGGDSSFDRATATSLIVPGSRLGLKQPLASLRMKAWREGLQTAELLRMLRTKRKWTDVQLRAWVGRVGGLSGADKAQNPPAEAGIVTFAGVDGARLMRLTRAALTELDGE